MPLHQDPLAVRLPYPSTPPPAPREDESYFPAFDPPDLAEARREQEMAHPPSAGFDSAATGGGVKLPASLRIGADSGQGGRSPPRASGEMWMNFQKDQPTLPDSLRPGAGAVRAKTPEGRIENVSMHGALETDPEVNPWSREKGTREPGTHGVSTGYEGQSVGIYGDLSKSLLPGGEHDVAEQDAWMHGALPESVPFFLPATGEGEPRRQSIPMHGALPASLPESLPASLPASLTVGGGEPAKLENVSPWAMQASSSSDCESHSIPPTLLVLCSRRKLVSRYSQPRQHHKCPPT